MQLEEMEEIKLTVAMTFGMVLEEVEVHQITERIWKDDTEPVVVVEEAP